jgi:catechol 2,3-dioxygenase-like lactoylglutathione lyase family enzyme
MRILSVRLGVSDGAAAGAQRFYQAGLGLPVTAHGFRAGHTTVELAPAETAPFYHFALRVPRNRFAAAREWIGRHAEILGDARFDNWNAEACYVEDPAGNIVELIAHAGTAERGAAGDFSAAELAGLSEVGIVVDDPAAAVAALERDLGLELWSGDAAQLAFVGAKAHTLILAPPGRAWLPTGRPSEPHAATVTVTGGTASAVVLATSPQRSVHRSG